MPRKSKEETINDELILKKDVKLKPNKSATTKKKTSTTKSTTAKSATKSKTSTTKKASTSSSKKTSTSSVKKNTTAKKTAKASSTSSTRRTSRKAKIENEENIKILEYYDLPYKYGNTIVKLLAQTPKTLFVYWEIAEQDLNDFKEKYGPDFFSVTKPILIVHNLTLNKTTEVDINDFANCWYLNTEDSDCKYDIELARKFIKAVKKPVTAKVNDYLFIAKSNELQAPNDHILFENLNDVVSFRNVNTNEVIEENIHSFKFLEDLFDFYKQMYDDELINNPSSKFSMQ